MTDRMLKDVEALTADLAELHEKIKKARAYKESDKLVELQRKYNATECVLNCVRMDALRKHRASK